LGGLPFRVRDGLGDGVAEGDGEAAAEDGVPLRAGVGEGLALAPADGLCRGEGASCGTVFTDARVGAGRGTRIATALGWRAATDGDGEAEGLGELDGTRGPCAGCCCVVSGSSMGVIGGSVVTPTAVPRVTAPTPAAV
jgi:hypothetical protein